jgi:hypothetical protein
LFIKLHNSPKEFVLFFMWASKTEAELEEGDDKFVDPPVQAFPFIRAYIDSSNKILRFVVPSIPSIRIPTLDDIKNGNVERYSDALFPTRQDVQHMTPALHPVPTGPVPSKFGCIWMSARPIWVFIDTHPIFQSKEGAHAIVYISR